MAASRKRMNEPAEHTAKVPRTTCYPPAAPPPAQNWSQSGDFNLSLQVSLSGKQVKDLLFMFGSELVFNFSKTMGLMSSILSPQQLTYYTFIFLQQQWQQGRFPLMENPAGLYSCVAVHSQTPSKIPVYTATGNQATHEQPQTPAVLQKPSKYATTGSPAAKVQSQTPSVIQKPPQMYASTGSQPTKKQSLTPNVIKKPSQMYDLTGSQPTQKHTQTPSVTPTGSQPTQKKSRTPGVTLTGSQPTQKQSQTPNVTSTASKPTQKQSQTPSVTSTGSQPIQKQQQTPSVTSTGSQPTQKRSQTPGVTLTGSQPTQKQSQTPGVTSTGSQPTQKQTPGVTLTGSQLTQKQSQTPGVTSTGSQPTQKQQQTPGVTSTGSQPTQKQSQTPGVTSTGSQPTQKQQQTPGLIQKPPQTDMVKMETVSQSVQPALSANNTEHKPSISRLVFHGQWKHQSTETPARKEVGTMTLKPILKTVGTMKSAVFKKNKEISAFLATKTEGTNTRIPVQRDRETSPLVTYIESATMTRRASKQESETSTPLELAVTPAMKMKGTVTIPLKQEKGTSTKMMNTPPFMKNKATTQPTKRDKGTATDEILLKDAQNLTCASDQTDAGTMTAQTVTNNAESSTVSFPSASLERTSSDACELAGSVNDWGLNLKERDEESTKAVSGSDSDKKVVKITINVKFGKRPQEATINLDESLVNKEENQVLD